MVKKFFPSYKVYLLVFGQKKLFYVTLERLLVIIENVCKFVVDYYVNCEINNNNNNVLLSES